MKKVSFTNFLIEKLTPLIPPTTKNRSAQIFDHLVINQEESNFLKYWFTVITLLLMVQVINAQTTFITCNQLFFDEGGVADNYIEGSGEPTSEDIFTICPDDPQNQVMSVEFNQFDVAPGDQLLAYNGASVDPSTLITASVGGEGTGSSVANAPGGGNVQASCDNSSGCLTFLFSNNNDGTTAAGWTFLAECANREAYSFPAAGTTQQITSTDDACSPDGLVGVSVTIPNYTDCDGNDLIITTDCPDASVMFLSSNSILVNAPIGSINVTFTSPLFPSQSTTTLIRTIPIPLTCNRDLEVSLSGDCIVPLTPDMVLEAACMSAGYEYTLSFIDPNRGMAMVGSTSDGYPIVDFSGVPCGTRLDVLVERVVIGSCGAEELPSACVAQMVVADRVDPVIVGDIDEYVIPCAYDTEGLLDRLNAAGNGSSTTISLEPEGVVGMTDMYDLDLTINSVASVFGITENCAADFVVGDWQFIELDCTTDGFDPYGTFDHDNDPNTPAIPVSQDPIWALMNIEVEDPNGTGGTPAIFHCYYRRIQAIDDCGNESNVALQRVCVAQPDIVFPLVEIALPCGADTDPIAIYNTWASDPDKFAEYATFIPVYDPTPLDLNGNFSLFGNLDDTYFTDASGDEVPVYPDNGACGYAIDWSDSRPIEVCSEAYKIFREWTVFNFCDGHLEIIDVVPQVIKVGDVAPPSLEFLGISGTGSAYADCVADALIQVAIQDDCSDEILAFVDFLNDDLPEQEYDLSDGAILVPNTPIGEELYFTIRLIDECWNNATFGPFVTILEDNIPPVAICESFRTVSMGVGCEVVVPAEVFDDGSYDNCGQVSYSVARMDEVGDFLFDENFNFLFDGDADLFQPTVSFTSADLMDCTGTVTVVFRVEDGSGNANFCMVEVELQDKLPPVVSDQDIVMYCEDHAASSLIAAAFSDDPNIAIQAVLNSEGDFTDAAGAPYISAQADNCDNASLLVDFVDATAFDPTCRQGTMTIFYQAIDACGNVSAPSVANIILKNRSNWTMNFPLDIEIFCEDNLGIPAAPGIDEILENNGCDFWGLEVEDNLFNTEGGCSKIIREYHFINWCTWNPSNTEIAVVERPSEMILDPYYTVSLRYQDFFANGTGVETADGLNDIDDGDEDADGNYIYDATDDRLTRFAPVSIPFSTSQLNRINDNDEAEAYDPYDVTELDFDADFAVIDYADFAYQNIATYAAISQFTSVEQHYVSAQAYGNVLYRQILKINDITAPNIDVTQSGPFCGGYEDPGEGGICSGEVDIKFSVRDLCTPATNVHYELIAFIGTAHEIIIKDDPFGSILEDGGDYKISGEYPIGIHQIVVKAEDGCSNVGKAIIDFEVKDCKAPSLTCYYGLSTDVMVNGEIEIWAEEFLNHVDEYCSEVELFFADPVLYPDSTSRTFRCINGEVGVVGIELWARDEAGNTSFCESFVNVQQNPQNGNIPDNCPVAGASIAGVIQTTDSEVVEGVEVKISGNVEQMKQTSTTGSFQFVGLEEGLDYSIIPYKNDDLLNGVTTLDIIHISKHILGIQPIESPYQLIAADVNNSGSVTTFDMVHLRKLILGIEEELKNNTSWRFIPRDYEFTDVQNPFSDDFPELMNINDLEEDYMSSDFVAIKVGDVNGSAIANSTTGTEGREGWESFEFQITNQQLEQGNTYHIPVRGNIAQIEGYQFTMNWEGIEVLEIENGWMNATHFGQFDQALTASWDKNTEEYFNESEAFTLVLRAVQNISLKAALRISSEKTTAVAYDEYGTPLSIEIDFIESAYQLAQNKPNPFDGETTIGIQLPAAQEARLTVHDIRGRVIYSMNKRFEQGYNEIILSSNDLPSGILYYTFETPDFVATRKMIVLEK